MISKDLTKRFITSVPLILLLLLSFNYLYVLIISLIFVSLISWIEFYGIISKIFLKKNYKYKIYNIIYYELFIPRGIATRSLLSKFTFVENHFLIDFGFLL